MQPRLPVADAVAPRLADTLTPASPADVRLSGWLGRRVAANAARRLLEVDEKGILEGFQHRPGAQAWIGEHVGKFLHAGTLAWVNSRDPKLKAKLDRVATVLLATQEPDGYLGTYAKAQRFGLYPNADWDVWVHKYCLLGLLMYHRWTGDPAALTACRRIGDLLAATFGPGKKRLIDAGTHLGMAATSVLEPMVLLYRRTGERRYLEFALGILGAWSEPGGPGILRSLSDGRGVERTANGKAYEMLSNLVGLVELARTTAEPKLLAPIDNAWQDIVAHHRYLTGSMSHGEHFHDDFDLPNSPGASIGETCVTVTWIQLNALLLALTGEARYGAELERSYYNHLAAAQKSDGALWCYYTPLEGTKPYGPGINCCVSSGPRGMAMAPTLAVLSGDGAIAINLLDSADGSVTVNGVRVRVSVAADPTRCDGATITLTPDAGVRFTLTVRVPEWAEGFSLPGATIRRGWATIPALHCTKPTTLRLRYRATPRRVAGDHTNAGREALTVGPFVLAYAPGPGGDAPHAVALSGSPPERSGSAWRTVGTRRAGSPSLMRLIPFADAGADGGKYAIWLRGPGATWPTSSSLLVGGEESRSRDGNQPGSTIDDDPLSFVVTFDGRRADADWYAVTLDRAVAARRFVFRHGRVFHDGGWFVGAPRIEIKRTATGRWERVGALDSYPATTATDARGLRDGQAFELRVSEPIAVVAVRVVGVPAHGDNPNQAFSSCAELAAFP